MPYNRGLITLVEAKMKFGNLLSPGPRVHYLQFKEPEGTWVPVANVCGSIIAYKLVKEQD